MPSERKMEAVLFDLDGTLVFHDQAQFLSEYFKSISAHVASLGYDPKEFLGAMDYAIKVMLVNDGARLNKDLFWIKFFEYAPKFDNKIIEASDHFYLGRFKELKAFAQENSLAKKAVELAHEKGRRVVLATNPVFHLLRIVKHRPYVSFLTVWTVFLVFIPFILYFLPDRSCMSPSVPYWPWQPYRRRQKYRTQQNRNRS